MAKRVKLYEKRQQGPRMPLWGWILAIIVVVTLLFLFFLHRKEGFLTQPADTPVSSLQILPATVFARDGVDRSDAAAPHLPATDGSRSSCSPDECVAFSLPMFVANLSYDSLPAEIHERLQIASYPQGEQSWQRQL